MKLPKFSSIGFLAPMAGISDPAFRLICKENGAGLVVTELTSVHAIVAKEKQLAQQEKSIAEFIEYSDKERPVSVQLFGSDIDLVVKAAKIVEPYFDIIDYNMGCPAPHITQQMAGAALLQKPDHVDKLFSALVSAVNKPVTLKVRAGISLKAEGSCFLYRNISKIAENCGVQMIALHARTLEQGYSGKSDWSLIKDLKERVNIPVVGNGDIQTPSDAIRMINETGCDYVMIGRAARGNPFIFQQLNEFIKKGTYKEISPEIKINNFFKYLEYTKNYKIPFALIRSQAMQFTNGLKGAPELRLKLGQAQTKEELLKLFEEKLEKYRSGEEQHNNVYLR